MATKKQVKKVEAVPVVGDNIVEENKIKKASTTTLLTITQQMTHKKKKTK